MKLTAKNTPGRNIGYERKLKDEIKNNVLTKDH